jgi:hypothetical protein
MLCTLCFNICFCEVFEVSPHFLSRKGYGFLQVARVIESIMPLLQNPYMDDMEKMEKKSDQIDD